MEARLFAIWGAGESLSPMSMAARAAAMFFILLAMIRVSGARSFGRKSSFDNVVVIMLGAIAARGVVGASPFGSTVAACAVVVAIHRILGRLLVTRPSLAKLIEGEVVPLYTDGQLLEKNMKRASICESDLRESARLERQSEDFSSIDAAFLERNGRISFVRRPSHD